MWTNGEPVEELVCVGFDELEVGEDTPNMPLEEHMYTPHCN
jgi:hypothetical protein